MHCVTATLTRADAMDIPPKVQTSAVARHFLWTPSRCGVTAPVPHCGVVYSLVINRIQESGG
jgi:hypothetical protein